MRVSPSVLHQMNFQQDHKKAVDSFTQMLRYHSKLATPSRSLKVD